MEKPKQLETPTEEQFKKLQKAVQIYLDEVEAGKAEDSDGPHFIFEETMKLFYGDKVFDYINEKQS